MGRGRVSVEVAAQAIGVSRNTVVAMLADGRLAGVDHGPGKRPRYELHRDSVESMRNAGARRTSPSQKVTRGTSAEDRPPGSFPAAEDPGRWGAPGAQDLEQLHKQLADLRAENQRLRLVARNANMAVQVQTESLQQYLVPDHAQLDS